MNPNVHSFFFISNLLKNLLKNPTKKKVLKFYVNFREFLENKTMKPLCPWIISVSSFDYLYLVGGVIGLNIIFSVEMKETRFLIDSFLIKKIVQVVVFFNAVFPPS